MYRAKHCQQAPWISTFRVDNNAGFRTAHALRTYFHTQATKDVFPPMDAGVNHVAPPKDATDNDENAALLQDSVTAADEEEEEDWNETFWKSAVIPSIRQDNFNKETLEELWKAAQRRRLMIDRFDKAALQSKSGLEDVFQQGLLNPIMQRLLEEASAIVRKLETEIEHLIRSNTNRRLDYYQRANKAQTRHNWMGKALCANILGAGEDPPDSPGNSSTENQGLFADDADLEDLLEQKHLETVRRLERFLQATRRLADVWENLKDSIRNVDAGMEDTTFTLMDFVRRAVFIPLFNTLHEEEGNLQKNLVRNHDRLDGMKEKMEAAQERFQDKWSHTWGNLTVRPQSNPCKLATEKEACENN